MTNLTIAKRRVIRKHVLAKLFDKRKEQLKKREAKLADMIYNAVFDKKTRDLMNSLPDGFLSCDIGISGRFNGQYGYFKFIELKRFPYKSEDIRFDVDHRLTKTYMKFRDDQTSYNIDHQEALERIDGYLHSFRTVKKLLEAWPELSKVMPKGYFDGTPNTALTVTEPPYKDELK